MLRREWKRLRMQLGVGKMREKTISDETHQAFVEAAGDFADGPEWFVIRHLAHAMHSTGAHRRLYLARFVENLEQFLKSEPN